MKHSIPLLRRSGGGSIINISSIYGLIGSRAAAAYQGTKGAVRLLTKTAAVQYAAEGIRVNSIHPGVIDTGMVEEEVQSAFTPVLTAATRLPWDAWADQRRWRLARCSLGLLSLRS